MDEADSTTGVGAAIAALAIITVVFRFYARYKTRAGLKCDDWLVLVSLSVCKSSRDFKSLLLQVLVRTTKYILVLYANGVNPTGAERASVPSAVDNAPADVLYTKISFIATVLYFAVTASSKLSILFLYNRLFSVSAKFRRHVIVLSCVVIGYWVGTTVADLLNCIPIKYTWVNSLADPRYCINYNIFWLATGVVEAFIDVLILLLPIEVVLKLHLSTKKKIAVRSVFIIGAFAIVSGVMKVVYGYVPGSRQPSFSRTLLWTTVHSGTGIICACLPVCWPVLVSLGKFREWNWVPSIKYRGHGFSGWSRLRAGSAPKENVTRYETPLDTKDRDMNISLNRIGINPFDREVEV
ncbi:hypothetical protein GGR51DRAFT_575083 [Nemania sp. FL0031]|nr:hypothetical protein GGR51DRAFT_575083 [Nemania sp. FL0031]